MAELPKAVRDAIKHAIREALGVHGLNLDVVTDAGIAAALDACEVREEWICTGEPGNGFPSHRFVWSTRDQYADDARREAAEFVKRAGSRNAWVVGPDLHRRLVITTPTEELTP
jgi:hypothetical protein